MHACKGFLHFPNYIKFIKFRHLCEWHGLNCYVTVHSNGICRGFAFKYVRLLVRIIHIGRNIRSGTAVIGMELVVCIALEHALLLCPCHCI